VGGVNKCGSREELSINCRPSCDGVPNARCSGSSAVNGGIVHAVRMIPPAARADLNSLRSSLRGTFELRLYTVGHKKACHFYFLTITLANVDRFQ